MGTMKTPGVYIVEKNAFPNSVVEVATAVPAFIGYTEKAENGSQKLLNIPFRITSLSEYEKYFGGAPTLKFSCKGDAGVGEGDSKTFPNTNLIYRKQGKAGEKDTLEYYIVKLEDGQANFSLYYNMRLFFANGGGPCYIVSVGSYGKAIDKESLIKGIKTLVQESEPTMVLVPEALNIPKDNNYGDIYTAMLTHCGAVMKNRITLLDVPKEGNMNDFREKVGSAYLSYGAAYYPFLQTSILSEKDVTYENMETDFVKGLAEELNVKLPADNASDSDKLSFHNLMYQNSPLYKAVAIEIRNQLNLLPPSAAMAGIYTAVDNSRGVWKAPANVSVNSVVGLSALITHEMQEDLNVPLNGKSINAIRYFTGDGIKVWGARTLDGNSLDWRYINVRRTMIFLEESIKNAARAYVFEPNVASTWLNMKSMIENFLLGVWKKGGLAGASPEDAYSVQVGLGETMTANDILEGILRITVLVAISHPAEFIEITFQQQMQKS